jgi:hypothetical protein
MSEVFQVYAQVAPRSGGNTGRVAEGWYKLEDDTLVMCDPDGVAIRDTEGARIEHKLAPGENPMGVAKRLTLKICRSLHVGDGLDGFKRPVLTYPKFVY